MNIGLSRLALAAGCLVAVAWQLWRVPRVWAAMLLFIVLMPKLALAAVPGNTTPIRVDDVVVAVVLGAWMLARALGRPRPAPHSPATPLIAGYGTAVIVASLLGIAALTTTAATVAFHFLRLVEYVLIYYFFYTTIQPDELPDVIRVFRFAFIMVIAIWIVQHETAAVVRPSLIDWSTLYPTFSATYDFGGYVMLATIVLYALWSGAARRDLLTTTALLLGLYLLVNSDSRSSLMGAAVAIGFDLFVRLRWEMAAGIISIAAAAPYIVSTKKMEALLNTIVALVGSFGIDTVQRTFFADPSIAMRLRNWRIALEHWLARPLVGEGLGAFLTYTRQYDQAGTPDGWYIRLLAETGLIGLLTFVLLIGGLMWLLLRAQAAETDPVRRAIVYGGALAVIATSVNALLIDTFVSYKIMGVFWMIVGVGTRLAADRPAAVHG